jgi:hypothetical protein
VNLLGQKIKLECESFDLKDFFVRFFFIHASSSALC